MTFLADRVDRSSTGESTPNVPTEIIAMPPNCTIRTIDGALQALRQARLTSPNVQVDCSAVTKVDLTFVQLITSAGKTFADRNVRLQIEPATAQVRAAFARSGLPLPGGEPSLSC